jgi:hypothetical protein
MITNIFHFILLTHPNGQHTPKSQRLILGRILTALQRPPPPRLPPPLPLLDAGVPPIVERLWMDGGMDDWASINRAY